MNPLSIITGFIPQVLVFAILAKWLPLGWAAAAGLAVALVLIVVTATHGGVKILLVVQAVILAVFTVIGFAAARHDATAFEPYARGVASLALGAFIVATSFSFPFTAQFARRALLQQYWHSPQFLAVNRRISLVWGLAVLAIGASHLAATTRQRHSGGPHPARLGRPHLRGLPGLLHHQGARSPAAPASRSLTAATSPRRHPLADLPVPQPDHGQGTDIMTTDTTDTALTATELDHHGAASHEVYTAGFYADPGEWDFTVRAILGKSARGGSDTGRCWPPWQRSTPATAPDGLTPGSRSASASWRSPKASAAGATASARRARTCAPRTTSRSPSTRSTALTATP